MGAWEVKLEAVRGVQEAEDDSFESGTIPFSNQYMFGRVMCREDICREFLGRILGIEITSIEYLNAKQVLEPTLTGKGSELDLFVRAKEGVFDVEMQCTPRGSLGRHFRYYQGAMDTTDMRKGDAYDQLPESAIVFVCDYDPFGEGLPVYRIESLCEGAPEADMDFGQVWVALNCPAWRQVSDAPLRNLLKYVAEGEAEPGDALVEGMAEAVKDANDDEKWVNNVCAVSYVLEDLERERGIAMRAAQREGHEQGLAQGIEEGRTLGIEIGIEQGRAEGIEQGRAEGIEQGIEQGENRLSALIAALLADGRVDNAAEAARSKERREQLFSDYGL